MPKEKYRYYMGRKKVVHRRAESWFSEHSDGERVYSESFTRVKGMDDLTPFVKPKSKAKSKTSKKKK
tara:strand:+ start:1008 stop:1208 length:201 start_codon:yes stop_codon:yes gene_type:complete